MADEANVEEVEETTDPSMDAAAQGVTDVNDEVVYKLHEEIDNLNLVLDHLEQKNGAIYSQMEQLLVSFQENKSTNN